MTASIPATDPGALETHQCWALLRSATLGRLAVVAEYGVDVFPVNYLVDHDTIVFRSAPGTKLLDITHDPVVAFEVDAVDDVHRWSVVVRGQARRLDSDDEIERSGVLDLSTRTPTAKHLYVRITPRVVTGRRYRWGGAA